MDVAWPYEMSPRNFARAGGDVTIRRRRTRSPESVFEGKMVSNAEGKLERILFFIPTEVSGMPHWCSRFSELIDKLPDYCEIVLAVSDDKKLKTIVNSWLKTVAGRKRSTIVKIDKSTIFSIWAQDPFVILEDPNTGANSFLTPLGFRRYSDGILASLLAPKIDYRFSQAQIYFEGGNFQVGNDFYLQGYDFIAESRYQKVLDKFPRKQEFINAYKTYLDSKRKTIIIQYGQNKPGVKPFKSSIDRNNRYVVDWTAPGKYQPIFHIDMFITLAGKGRSNRYKVFVGDPAGAARLLNEPVHPFAKQEVFDAIASDLKSRHPELEVIRMPLPLTTTVIPRKTARNDLEMYEVPSTVNQVVLHYFASYNNCIVEVTNRSKRVWMPTYGYDGWRNLSVVDDAVEQLWRSHGFSVCRLGNFHPFMLYQGGAHCLIKYLKRGS